jgi:hypothetical protein
MKVGLVGEASNDTRSIQNLLSKRYKNLDFITLIDRINGSMLDNKKALNQFLKVEFEYNAPDLVIFIRDLDSHERDKQKIKEREGTFKYSNQIVNNRGIFLLNVYELEALILADIDVFNKEYQCAVESYNDPMKVKNPKEVLYKATRTSNKRFDVSHNPELFNLLNFDVVKANCRYFSRFIKNFDNALKF